MDITEDQFLGGRLKIRQPKTGYRAGADPVFLSAAIDAKPGETVLDLGCGVGVAMICLKSRLPNVIVTGVELQQELAGLCRQNLAANKLDGEVLEADVNDLPQALRERSFDHVLTNPPFFDVSAGSPAAHEGRELGRRTAVSVETWLGVALRRLKPEGTLTLINRIEQLPACLAAVEGRAGAIRVLPLSARIGKPAKLFLLKARKGAKTPMTLLHPLVLHDGEEHVQDGDSYSEIAKSVLREGKALRL